MVPNSCACIVAKFLLQALEDLVGAVIFCFQGDPEPPLLRAGVRIGLKTRSSSECRTMKNWLL